MIFAREISAPLTSLVKKVDEATAKHADAKMGSFVVFCGANDATEKQIKELADHEGIKNTILTTIDKANGPASYKVAPEADVTVVLYREHVVKANHSFSKGAFTDADVNAVVQDIAKILEPSKDSTDKEKDKGGR